VGRARDRRDWEELAELDPLWAVATKPGTRFAGWDVDAFFAAGERRIDSLMRTAQRLGVPRGRDAALDFGCGVGRLTRPLAHRFDEALGVDVSEAMVARARELNAEVRDCRFAINARADLGELEDASFDLVHSRLVLQHIAPAEVTGSWLPELVRVLRPGGLLTFQLPARLPLRARLQVQRRVYRGLRSLGVPAAFAYRRLRLQPMRMTAIAPAVVRATLEAAGARVLEVSERPTRSGVVSATYLATRD